jgi:ribosomal protein S18 acetylase RimI-like enzyme
VAVRSGRGRAERQFTIRRASKEDAAGIAYLAELTFTETFGHLYPPEDLAAYVARSYTRQACLETLSDPRMAYWLADAGGEPAVGFALAGYCKLPVEGLEPTAGELRQLYVRSAYQKQRLGTRLFAAALEWLEARYSPLFIGVWSKNHGAQRFYGRYGFVKVGEYGFPVGKTVDLEFILRR